MKPFFEKETNNLWFQILKNTTEVSHLKESSTVELKVENKNSAVVPKRNLKNILEGINPENLHKEVDWGKRESNEAW